MTDSPRSPAPADFSPFEGGGLFRLLRLVGLSGDAPGQVRRRVITIVLVAWLPLAVLAAAEGSLYGDSISVPFLLDAEAHIRFLVVLPLLILAEVEVHRRLPELLRQFAERGLVTQLEGPRFDAIVSSGFRVRNSVLPEILILAIVYGVGIFVVWRQFLMLDAATWYSAPAADGRALTLAGHWYGYVSLPIVQFLLLRWYFRLLLWSRLLWQLSRLKLDLTPAHPDRAGGLGFLADVGYAFAMLALAHGALAAGYMASRIFFEGATMPQFGQAIAAVVVFMQFVVFGPMLFFAGGLLDARYAGLIRYGTLADRYVRGFDAKWTSGQPSGEPLLGSPDIQSLADLANSFEVVHSMRLTPITLHSATRLAIATLLPVAPLLLTAVPLNEALKMLFGLVL